MTAPAARTILASGFGATGGGLYALEADEFTALDTLETVGMAVSPSGDRLARALVGYLDGSAPANLLMYDAAGVAWYRRGAGIHDVHGLVWTADDELAVVSTSTNAVHWIDDAGSSRRAVRFAEAVDAWHLNCPAVAHDGALVVTAFGRTDAEQAWRPGLRAGASTGVVWDVDGGVPRLEGLRGPHDPLALPDGTWLICNSAEFELLQLTGTGTVVRRAHLGGWTRGLLLDGDDGLYVGVSTRRHEGERGSAAVLHLDLASFAIDARWSLPCEEVFSIVAVEAPLLGGLRRGFGVLPGFSDAGRRAAPASPA